MSGPVLCALPSVAPQPAVQLPSMSRTAQQPLPYIETFSRQCSTCISLPPLPRYPDPGFNRKRWGEDNVIFKNTIQNACSGRNNFDSCHSVPDVQASKYEGYMFPKPMYQDLTVLHSSPKNTKRHVPKDLGPELFPTHDPLRKNGDTHSYKLTEATRKALSDYITRLYRTSRYDLNFRDTTEFMKLKADRDQQYKDLCGDLTYPNPFPYLYAGGIDNITRQGGATQPTDVGSDCLDKHHVVADTSCDQTRDTGNADNDAIETKLDPSGDGKSDEKTSEEVESNELNVNSIYPQGNGDCNRGDMFGPWSGRSNPTDDCESLLMSHVYNFKLPSSHHNAQTQNEYASSHIERHSCNQRYQNHADYIGSWTALRRPKITNHSGNHNENNGPECVLVDILHKQYQNQEILSKSKQNCWTFRDDKNNLRIPCISKVIGFKNKTDAHNRIHMDHPEPIPDLRDFKRYSKRVNFFGYNSSVFR